MVNVTGMTTMPSLVELEKHALSIRRWIVRMIGEAGSGHPGGSLSAVEILTALYFAHLRVDPAVPSWAGRDWFILSKGHAAPVLYAALAERGYFDPAELTTLRKLGSRLQGHPDMRKLPGVEASTGSLGQGLSFANGVALAMRLDGRPNRVYVLLGDGEVQEGQVWEAAMTSAHYRLGNLVAVLDNNGLQIDGPVEEIMSVSPLAAKWRAFGWEVREVDGHDLEALLSAFRAADESEDRPVLILAHTIKGKGVSYMENIAEWHGTAPTPEQVRLALVELGEQEGEKPT